MKYTALRSFKKHLDDSSPDHFSSLYLLLVQDSYERQTALDCLLSSLLKGESQPDLSLRKFDAESMSTHAFLDELNSFHFFSQRKVLLVQQAEKIKPQVKEFWEKVLEKLNRKTILILSASSMNANTNFYKKIEKIGVVLDLNREDKPWEREKLRTEWLIEKARKEGKTWGKQASQTFLKRVGLELSSLEQEFQKLLCFVGQDEEISLQDVLEVSTDDHQESIWQLGEAIFYRNLPMAVHISRSFSQDVSSLLLMLRSLRRQFQTALQVSTILSGGGREEEVKAKFPYMKGEIFQKHFQMNKAYGIPLAFVKGLLVISEAEWQAKNSGLAPKVLAELLVINLVYTSGLKN